MYCGLGASLWHAARYVSRNLSRINRVLMIPNTRVSYCENGEFVHVRYSAKQSQQSMTSRLTVDPIEI